MYSVVLTPSASALRYTVTEDGSLLLHGAQVTDTGSYLCMATNPAGTQQRRVDLQVHGEDSSANTTTCTSSSLLRS